MSRTKVAKLCHTFIKDGAVGTLFLKEDSYVAEVRKF